MYRANATDSSITSVEVKKVTEKSVILVDGHRRDLETSFFSYHRTFSGAKDWLYRRANHRKHEASLALIRAEMVVAKIAALEEEGETPL